MLDILSDISFASPWAFWLLLVIPFIIAYYIWKQKNMHPEFRISTLAFFNLKNKKTKVRFIHFPFVLRIIALATLIICLARPQSKRSWQDVHTEGIDIVLALDISASMLAQDLKPNRLEAAKDVALNFIESRPNDRIGLVIFSGESFTQCPLTTDHSVLKNLFKDIKIGMINNGTAIGDGLANAINRVRNSKAKSKVVILMTDGENNAGNIGPITAAEAARPFGVRIYTIGVGTRGMAYSPVALYPNGQYAYEYVKCDIDEVSLKKVSSISGGNYFRATDKKSLEKIYSQIDKLEKTFVEEKQYTHKSELFWPLAVFAFLVLVLEYIIKNIWLRIAV
jgi:Ca-activated chloride channel family protein